MSSSLRPLCDFCGLGRFSLGTRYIAGGQPSEATFRNPVAFDSSSAGQHFFLGLTTPPRAWRPGLEPAELSFRVPHFFHQTRRGSRGTMNLHDAHFPGNRKVIDVYVLPIGLSTRSDLFANSLIRLSPNHSFGSSRQGKAFGRGFIRAAIRRAR
jgi:hypothetical protein